MKVKNRPRFILIESQVILMLARYYRKDGESFTCFYPIDVTLFVKKAGNIVNGNRINQDKWMECPEIKALFDKFWEYTNPKYGEKLDVWAGGLTFMHKPRCLALVRAGMMCFPGMVEVYGWDAVTELVLRENQKISRCIEHYDVQTKSVK